MPVTMKISGDKELLNFFRTMPKEIKGKAGKLALNKAGGIILRAAKANIPGLKWVRRSDGVVFDTNQLKKNIIKVVRKGHNGDPYVLIGEKASRFAWGHWLELGTLAFRKAPLKKKRSSKAQKMADKGIGLVKHPWLRPAFLSKRRVVKAKMGEILLDSITKTADKLVKKL